MNDGVEEEKLKEGSQIFGTKQGGIYYEVVKKENPTQNSWQRRD